MSFLKKRGKVWYIYEDNNARSLHTTDGEVARQAKVKHDYDKAVGDLGLPNAKKEWPELEAKFFERFSEKQIREKNSTYLKYFYSCRLFKQYAKIIKLSDFHYQEAYDCVNALKNGSWESAKKKVKKPYSATQINIFIRNMKTIFKFAADLKWLKENPFEKIEEIDRGKKIPKALTIAQVKAVLDQAKASESEVAYLIALTLYYTGFRRATIPELKRGMIDLERGRIYLRGTPEWQPKNGDDAAQPIHLDLLAALKKYLKTRTDDSEYLFPGKDGGKRDKYSLGRLFNKLFKRAGIALTGVHVFRHSFGTQLMTKNQPDVVRDAMHHSDIKTTMVYDHVRVGAVDEAIQTLPGLKEINKAGGN